LANAPATCTAGRDVYVATDTNQVGYCFHTNVFTFGFSGSVSNGIIVSPPTTTFTSQSSFTYTHNLNTAFVFVTCWDATANADPLIPSGWVATSVNSTTVSFSSPQSGTCAFFSNSAALLSLGTVAVFSDTNGNLTAASLTLNGSGAGSIAWCNSSGGNCVSYIYNPSQAAAVTLAPPVMASNDQFAVIGTSQTFTADKTFNAKLNIAGNFAMTAITTAGSGTIGDTDPTIETFDASGGAVASNLPASPSNGRLFILQKSDSSANTVTISGNTHTINGASSLVLTGTREPAWLLYNGSNWINLYGNYDASIFTSGTLHAARLPAPAGGGPSGGVASITASVGPVTTAATAFASYVVPGSTIQAGTTYRVKAYGLGTSTTSPGTGTFTLYYGANADCSTDTVLVTQGSITGATSGSNIGFDVEFLVTFRSTTSANASMDFRNMGITGLYSQNAPIITVVNTVTGLTTTTNQSLYACFVETNANTSATFAQGIVELVNP
jgi:hypothetical protein